ncbi:MAG TPA: penicillin-binding transpeptidase domain-containing protein, partial [Methylomirabilota bacterium]|nr:penicillin-binding transpeptidase domain-containing protein [Methylomirabilota bacterium]
MLIFDQLKKSDAPLRVLALIMLAGIILLLGGLWYVQIISSRHYVADLRTQSFRKVRIPAIRGKILDRHGAELAVNRPDYSIVLYLEELRTHFQDVYTRERDRINRTRVARGENRLTATQRSALGEYTRYLVASNVVHQVSTMIQTPLTLDRDEFKRHYTQRLALPLPIVENLIPEQVIRFEEQPVNPTGVDLQIQPYRHYPHTNRAAHLLGYLIKDNRSVEDEDAFFNYRLVDYRGVIGLERTFDSELRGRAGVKSVLVNNLGYRQSENIWTPADPGQNLILTIDLGVQIVAEQALEEFGGQDVRGAVVVLDPRNGDIVAMVSRPGYDPGMFIRGFAPEELERWRDTELTPELNRATQGIYPPGSIFKIVVGLACLEKGLNPNTIIESPGFFRIGSRGRPWRDLADGGRPSRFNFRTGFIKSSNFYFQTNGVYQAGLQAILNMGHQFHLGESWQIPTYQNHNGHFPTQESIRNARKRGEVWTDGDTANLCIGQGDISVTPIQMAVMTAAVANGGEVYWPRLVERLEAQEVPVDGSPVTAFPPRLRNRLDVSPRNLRIVQEAMYA